MSKASKTQKGNRTLKPNGKVTDFFHVVPSSSRSPPSSQPLSSQPKAMLKQPQRASQSGLKVKKDNIPPKQDQEVISISSGSHITVSSNSVICLTPSQAMKGKARAMMDGVEIASPRKTRAATVISVSSGSEAPPKRTAPPNSKTLAAKASSQKPQSRTSVKRKKKFDLNEESDSEPSLSVVRVSRSSVQPVSKVVGAPHGKTSSPQRHSDKPSPKKRAKLERELAPPAEEEERVPSSQSDEQELTLPPVASKDPEETKEHIEQWRRETSLIMSQPDHDDGWIDSELADIDVEPAEDDNENLEASVTMRSETEVSALLHAWTPSTSTSALPPATAEPDEIFRPFTSPPTHEFPAFPVTPVAAATGASRAQEIIARIQAEAAALSDSEEEEKQKNKISLDVELPDLSDSSSGDEDHGYFSKNLASRAPTTPKSNTKSSILGAGSPLTPLTTPLGGSSSALTPLASSRPPSPRKGRRSTRLSSKPIPYVLLPSREKPKAKLKPRKKGADPLDAMLKEKTLSERKGLGVAGKDGFKEEMEEWHEDEVDVERDVEESDEDEDDILDDNDRLRLLGEKRGQAVGAILEKDKRMKGKEREGEGEPELAGVEIFEGGVLVDVRDAVERARVSELTLASGEKHPVLKRLQEAVGENDFNAAETLINACICVGLSSSQVSSLLPWLYKTACSPDFGFLSEMCFQSIVNLAPRLSEATALSVVPMMHVAMARLGAKREFMEVAGCDAEQVKRKVVLKARAEILYRMVYIASLLAGARAVPVPEVPDLVFTLVLIGLDSSTVTAESPSTAELRRRVVLAIDAAARLWEMATDSSAPPEQILCDKLITLSGGLTALNKAHLFSLLACGSPLIGRISRFVARTLLISAHNSALSSFAKAKEEKGELDTVPPTQPLAVPRKFNPLPSLKPLIVLLSPPIGSGALFDMSNPDVDYDELGQYVELLSVMLSDVEAYVAEERRSPVLYEDVTASPGSSPRKGGEKPPTVLETVKDLVYSVHGKIVDTRAAHLDRSRTKAALQRLSMRLHFQRLAALKAGPARQGQGPSAAGTVRPRTLKDLWKGGKAPS
ncbi:hypothetical protein OE88DRAFT_1655060 [Heliocybe sulcata]|uniref:Uncharacterized protein n=1 Tax=Heliocybe sulcata TaxID=5364 RepID=A0A5C3N9Q7_9AGAM|nr:hypothetical protein OE88DRAFT_1655060 [Heliocybe sulcata]